MKIKQVKQVERRRVLLRQCNTNYPPTGRTGKFEWNRTGKYKKIIFIHLLSIYIKERYFQLVFYDFLFVFPELIRERRLLVVNDVSNRVGNVKMENQHQQPATRSSENINSQIEIEKQHQQKHRNYTLQNINPSPFIVHLSFHMVVLSISLRFDFSGTLNHYIPVKFLTFVNSTVLDCHCKDTQTK